MGVKVLSSAGILCLILSVSFGVYGGLSLKQSNGSSSTGGTVSDSPTATATATATATTSSVDSASSAPSDSSSSTTAPATQSGNTVSPTTQSGNTQSTVTSSTSTTTTTPKPTAAPSPDCIQQPNTSVSFCTTAYYRLRDVTYAGSGRNMYFAYDGSKYTTMSGSLTTPKDEELWHFEGTTDTSSNKDVFMLVNKVSGATFNVGSIYKQPRTGAYIFSSPQSAGNIRFVYSSGVNYPGAPSSSGITTLGGFSMYQQSNGMQIFRSTEKSDDLYIGTTTVANNIWYIEHISGSLRAYDFGGTSAGSSTVNSKKVASILCLCLCPLLLISAIILLRKARKQHKAREIAAAVQPDPTIDSQEPSSVE